MTKYPVGRRGKQKEQKEHCKRKLLSMIGALEVPQEGQGRASKQYAEQRSSRRVFANQRQPPSRSEKQTIVQLRDSD